MLAIDEHAGHSWTIHFAFLTAQLNTCTGMEYNKTNLLMFSTKKDAANAEMQSVPPFSGPIAFSSVIPVTVWSLEMSHISAFASIYLPCLPCPVSFLMWPWGAMPVACCPSLVFIFKYLFVLSSQVRTLLSLLLPACVLPHSNLLVLTPHVLVSFSAPVQFNKPLFVAECQPSSPSCHISWHGQKNCTLLPLD